MEEKVEEGASGQGARPREGNASGTDPQRDAQNQHHQWHEEAQA